MVTAGADKYNEVCLTCILCVTRWCRTFLMQTGEPLCAGAARWVVAGGGRWHVPVMFPHACFASPDHRVDNRGASLVRYERKTRP